MKRGEIWWVALDPTVGSEIQKTWPCLIISPNVMVGGLRTVIVAPLTSQSKAASFRPPVTFKGTSGLILLDQLRTVDKKRLRTRMGKVDDATMAAVLNMLRWIFTE
jgi:mRNA interferase MazF